MVTILTSTGGYSTAGYAHARQGVDTAPLHALAAELAGRDLNPAETRVLEDEALDTFDGDPRGVIVSIVGDARDLGEDDDAWGDLEVEVEEAYSNL